MRYFLSPGRGHPRAWAEPRPASAVLPWRGMKTDASRCRDTLCDALETELSCKRDPDRAMVTARRAVRHAPQAGMERGP